MNSLEELKVYQVYVDLYYYTYRITEKYPKAEKVGLVNDIKRITCKGLEDVIEAQRTLDYGKRIAYLYDLDTQLKILKVLVRISYQFKYINGRNYGAWSKKLASVANLLNGWIKQCRKQ